jgi:hypothetical protein
LEVFVYVPREAFLSVGSFDDGRIAREPRRCLGRTLESVVIKNDGLSALGADE